jgi:hypothetical protein
MYLNSGHRLSAICRDCYHLKQGDTRYFYQMMKEMIIFTLVLLHIIGGFGYVFYKMFKKPNNSPKGEEE